MKNSKKNMLLAIGATGLAAALGIGGTLAYLTDNETHTNTFTVGEVKINLLEPNWPQEDTNNDGVPDEAEDIVPNQEILKDPLIENQGDNGSMVFLRVTVPVKDVTMVGDDGLLIDKEGNPVPRATDVSGDNSVHYPQELFFFKSEADPEGSHVNNFNVASDWNSASNVDEFGYWIELPAHEVFEFDNGDGTTNGAYNVGTEGPGDTTTPGVDQGQVVGQRVYVFGYSRVLNPRDGAVDGNNIYDRTEPLFDKVQLKNIIENEIATDQIQNIKIEAFAIQADNIIRSDAHYLLDYDAMADTDKLDALTEVYDIYVNQNGVFDGKGDMTYNKWQDEEHGPVEKEADLNNGKNLKGDVNTNTQIRLSVADSILTIDHPAGVNDADINSERNLPTATNAVVEVKQTGKDYTGYTFGSTNENVATVDPTTGAVTAVGIGDTTIYATTNDGARASVHISVQRDSRQTNLNDATNNGTYIPQANSEP